ncbi:hypothetical protein ACFXOS_03205 [Streptomyces sp. NPDC059175]|uniref:hypothetical protein n=1 Tax=Streptomyces sp. NPDC059175 TaxID=3346757 RepID=UPI0036C49FC9
MPRRSRWRIALASAAASLIAAAPLITAGPAHAQYPPTAGLLVDDTTLFPGQTVTIGPASGYQINEAALARLVSVATGAGGAQAAPAPQARAAERPMANPTDSYDRDHDRPTHSPSPTSSETSSSAPPSGPVNLATFIADSGGVVNGQAEIPRDTPTGTYNLQLIGQESGRHLYAQVTVDPRNGGGQPGDGDGDGDGDHGRPGNGDGDHGRPGNGGDGDDHGRGDDGDHGDDHGRGDDGDHGRGDDGDHGRGGDGDHSWSGGGNDHDSDKGDKGDKGDRGDKGDKSDKDKVGLANTGSSDAPVALITVAGGLLLLGGGSLLIAKRRRSGARRG